MQQASSVYFPLLSHINTPPNVSAVGLLHSRAVVVIRYLMVVMRYLIAMGIQ